MKVLFVAAECSPIVKIGGLADVVGSLPKALKELGVDVRIFLPKYKIIDLKNYFFKLLKKDIEVDSEKINLYQGFLPKTKVILYLLENEKYFGQNGVYLDIFDFKGIERFLFFSKAVLAILPYLNWKPQILHCHDWHTAILAPLSKIKKEKIKTLLTIHNLAHQGKWPAQEIFDFLGLKGNEIESLKVRDKDGDFNILEQGILAADILTTVSPTYSQEIFTKEYGFGLENDLKKRKRALFGILNGIDTELFNPETDPNLKSNYSLENLEKKIENKIHLQKILNLTVNSEIPLFGFVSRLDSQKGLDLIEKALPYLINLNCQLVFLAKGKERYEKMLIEFSRKYPKNLSANIKFDPILARKIYAGSDIFLIPSLFEPCGLVQMISQRYGTIPLARKTGGLADTIEDGKTGFLFKEYQLSNFLKTIKKALQKFSDKKKWRKMQKRAMRKDFSWKKSAKKYFLLYKKLWKNINFY